MHLHALPQALLLLLLLLGPQQLRAQDHAAAQHLPTAVRRMPPDSGEKLMAADLAFGSMLPRDDTAAGNASVPYFVPAFQQHQTASERARGLARRQFACPPDTSACTNIEQPNYCCEAGTTCFGVDGGGEEVGCCPEGQDCAGAVGACSQGDTACPAEQGGGCCIEGFVCAEVGCVATSSSILTTTVTRTTVVVGGGGVTTPTTVVTTITSSSSSDATTTTTDATATSTTTTGGGLPPVRPTSSASTTTTAPASSTSSSGYCPTGFYACLASAGGGCCRTGRDCATTSCPPVSSTTITRDGATVVVPASDAPAPGGGDTTCAGGWTLCGGGGDTPGCCPDGYTCGTASCTLVAASATRTVQKELPGQAAGVGRGWGEALLGALCAGLVGVLMCTPGTTSSSYETCRRDDADDDDENTW
ncbi:hypothetical protein F4780DRAFT_793390 [Xylariomycetidae sp. FL0641]|nr:hypothetical protein F4780DRAFT_793390 [Xylariomycetidae sp. FL0641]